MLILSTCTHQHLESYNIPLFVITNRHLKHYTPILITQHAYTACFKKRFCLNLEVVCCGSAQKTCIITINVNLKYG